MQRSRNCGVAAVALLVTRLPCCKRKHSCERTTLKKLKLKPHTSIPFNNFNLLHLQLIHPLESKLPRRPLLDGQR